MVGWDLAGAKLGPALVPRWLLEPKRWFSGTQYDRFWRFRTRIASLSMRLSQHPKVRVLGQRGWSNDFPKMSVLGQRGWSNDFQSVSEHLELIPTPKCKNRAILDAVSFRAGCCCSQQCKSLIGRF